MSKSILVFSFISALFFSLQVNAAKPEGVGKPDGVGKPEQTGQPEDAGRPEGKGKPEETGKPAKVRICHNGSTYDAETGEDNPISFVLELPTKAVTAHLNNHMDCETIFEEVGEGTECSLSDDGLTVLCETVTLCNCLDVLP